MGIYEIGCPQCGKAHLWFSGCANQRCEACMKSDKVEPITIGGEKFILYSAYKSVCEGRDLTVQNLVKAEENCARLVKERDEARAELSRATIVNKTDHRFQPYHNMLEAERAKSAKLVEALKDMLEDNKYCECPSHEKCADLGDQWQCTHCKLAIALADFNGKPEGDES